MPPRRDDNLQELWKRYRHGDRRALSRLLTLAREPGRGAPVSAFDAQVAGAARSGSRVVAFTGSAGVGKSSLLGALCQLLDRRGKSIGVLACDPESPVTGGALLGDRCRIAGTELSERIFIRSLSARTGQQGIAEHLDAQLDLMRGFGFEVVLVETVGIGQGDTAVRNLADVLVLVLQPQTGDELQWEKAGLLEVADVVVINKGDLPGGDRTVADVTQQLRLPGRDVAVLKTSAVRGEGIVELWEAIEKKCAAAHTPPAPAVFGGRGAGREGARSHSPGGPPHPDTLPAKTPGAGTGPMTDPLLADIAHYVSQPPEFSNEAYDTARLCLMDSLGCALLALNYPDCTKLLGPVVPGATLSLGARVPGTTYELDPVQAAFNIGCLIRWLDYNDTWLAAEWGHPSDNFGGILAVADYLCRLQLAEPSTLNAALTASVTVRDVLTAAIQAYEIQGVLALENAFNRVGLDHVLLVRIATTAVVTRLLGGSQPQIVNAVSNAFLDGGALRTYRHAPNTGSRKSWAAGDATRRGVQHALWAMAGEMGYPTALTAPRWGFQDVVLGGKPLVVNRPLGCYVMEHVLFKVSYPAEFHAQTAAEAVVALHPQVIGRLDDIDHIVIETHESAMRIINKTGPLNNPADRDHCLQYITAVALLHGTVTSDMYEAEAAADPRIDRLRDRMRVVEEPRYSREYLDPDKRSIANAVQVFFTDGSSTPRIEVEFPLGHRRRRAEALPFLREKFRANAATRFDVERIRELVMLFDDPDCDKMPIDRFIDLLVPE